MVGTIPPGERSAQTTLYKTEQLGHNDGMASKPRLRAQAVALLQELKTLAEQQGIRVREEKLLGGVGYRVRSGGCRVHGKDTVFLDRNIPLAERVELLLDELCWRDINTDTLSPPLRRALRGGVAL